MATRNIILGLAIFAMSLATSCGDNRRTIELNCEADSTEPLCENNDHDPGNLAGAPEPTREIGQQPETGPNAHPESESLADANTPEERDSGNPAETAAPNSPAPPAPAPLHQLETPDYGVLMRSTEPVIVVISEGDPVMRDKSEIVTADFFSNGWRYLVRVFGKDQWQEMEDWAAHSAFGDSIPSANTVRTADHETASLYETNDHAALPEIHAMIATGRLVYRIDWTNPSFPENSDAALVEIRGNSEFHFRIPEHFRNFVRMLEVQ